MDNDSRGCERDTVDAFAQGRAAWPQLILAESQFVLHLARCLSPDDDHSAASGKYIHAADLYLAAACLDLVPGAADTFQRQYRAAVIGCLKRVGTHFDSVDDLAQALFIRVLVGTEDNPARLRQYRGRSALRGWIESAARRMVLNDRRTSVARKRLMSRLAAEPCLAPPDPFDLLAKEQATRTFKSALTAAFAALPPRDRQLLRFAFDVQMSTVEISRIFAVDHSTVSRWLARARGLLRSHIEVQLSGQFQGEMHTIGPSLLAALQELDVSL